MTKYQYFEMCEMMNMEPVAADIPIEISDFPDQVQTAFQIYHVLQDVWEGMSGTYMGKNMAALFEFFKLYEIDTNSEQLFVLSVIRQIDFCRSDVLQKKQKAQEALSHKKA
jgi:hypothetical protein